MNTHRFTALAVAIVVVAGLPRLSGMILDGTEDDPLRPELVTLQPPADANRAELDRRIAALTRRLDSHETYLDVRTLGTLHLARADLTGNPDDYRQADALLTEAHRRDGDDPEASVALANVALARHDFARAAELASAVLAAAGDRLEARAVEADAALAVGDLDVAAAAVAQLSGLLPDDPSVAVRRAELAWITGDVATATSVAAEAVELAAAVATPDLGFYLTYAGTRALDTGNHDQALGWIERALELDPNDAPALAARARLAAATGDLAAAVAHYTQATRLRPEPGWLSALVDAASAEGDGEAAADARSTLDAVAALLGDDPAHRAALARHLVDHGDPARALELAESEAEVRQDPATLDLLGWSLASNGRLDEARMALDRALAFGIADARLLFHSGVVALRLGDEARAVADLARALAIDPRFDPVDGPAAAAFLEERAS